MKSVEFLLLLKNKGWKTMSKQFERHYTILTKEQIHLPPPNLLRADQFSSDLRELEPFVDKETAFDYETSGLAFMEEGFFVRSVSFHNDDGSIAIELCDVTGNYYPNAGKILHFIATHEKLIAHNALFEVGVTYAMTDITMKIHRCTYQMAKTLANEGSPGQSWGLKALGKELFGLGDWSKDLSSKANMALDSWGVLGTYNQIDSAVTWELYKMMCRHIHANYDSWGRHYIGYLDTDVKTQFKLQTEAYIHGLRMDSDYTDSINQLLLDRIEERKQKFLQHPKVAPHVKAYNKIIIKKAKEDLEKYDKKYKKDGTATINYIKKQQKLEVIKKTEHFNIDSSLQLKWLLYSGIGVEPKIFTDTGEPSTGKTALSFIPVFGELLLDYRNEIAQYKFIRACRDNQKYGILRISVKFPGTITGRLSSNSIKE